MVHDGKLVCYSSDENDYLGFDPVTGAPRPDPDNDTAIDSHHRILVHEIWDGSSANWSDPVVDVAGPTQNMDGGKTQIGGGRHGSQEWRLVQEAPATADRRRARGPGA